MDLFNAVLLRAIIIDIKSTHYIPPFTIPRVPRLAVKRSLRMYLLTVTAAPAPDDALGRYAAFKAMYIVHREITRPLQLVAALCTLAPAPPDFLGYAP
ncbi:hypothetical protein AB1N83_004112 [Pleurotus pulmonarius]